MKVRKVISTNNLPRKMPIHLTVTAWLFLSYVEASQLVWGIVGTVAFLVWVAYFHERATKKEEEVELFNDNES